MMDDSAKSRDQLVSELGALRRQVAQLRAGGGSQTADPVGPAGVPSLDWELHQASGSCDVGGVVGTAIDVTQRKKVESELLADRRLMKQLLLAHERDRRLIAYEIHDGLVQDVTGAQMQLEAVLRDERLPAGLVRERVQAASELARKAIGEARHLIGGLRPPALDELGIVAALEFLVGEQSERGTKVDFVACVTFDRLEPLLEGAIYRIVQEALTNVQRHSQAFRARVRLNQAGSRLHLEIRDWGIGFDPATVPGNRFGLDGIRERVRLVRGELSIEGDLGKGTRVFVDIPLVQSIEPVARSLEAANTTHRSIE